MEPSSGHNLSMKKTTFRALKRAIKLNLLLIFVVIIPIALQKLKKSTEGFSFADKSPGTDPTYAA